VLEEGRHLPEQLLLAQAQHLSPLLLPRHLPRLQLLVLPLLLLLLLPRPLQLLPLATAATGPGPAVMHTHPQGSVRGVLMSHTLLRGNTTLLNPELWFADTATFHKINFCLYTTRHLQFLWCLHNLLCHLTLMMKDCNSFSTRSKAIWYASNTSSCTPQTAEWTRLCRRQQAGWGTEDRQAGAQRTGSDQIARRYAANVSLLAAP